MLTIGELASYAGVTIRTVRHYHAKGLLPEPRRDHSGYRRYDAAAVIELIRIRTLAEAGVPLARIRQLLDADARRFATVVADIDERLRAEIRERERHRARLAGLVSGDGLALPPEVVAVLDRLRELGTDERIIRVERDGWILLAAHSPERIAEWATHKRDQLDTSELADLYLGLGAVLDRAPDDPALEALADRMAHYIDRPANAPGDGTGIAPPLIRVLDALAHDAAPAARRLLTLLGDRGWGHRTENTG